MYYAIVFLPLLGAIVAGLIALAGAAGRNWAGTPALEAADPAGNRTNEAHSRAAHEQDGVESKLLVEGRASPSAATGSSAAEIVTTVFLFAAMLLSWFAFVEVGFFQRDSYAALFPWMIAGDLKVEWALRIDSLTAVMLVVVTTISAFVHLYSIGYMEEDPHRPRFFAYLSLFTFAMLMLVTSDNLVQLFFGWEGVGLMSYLLIGFWFQKPEANAAAIKAFIVNRMGDFGFALGIFAVFVMTGAIDFGTVFAQAPSLTGRDHPFPFMGGRRADADLPALVHGSHGQIGAIPAAHLASGRHGRADAGLGLDPCRHHGHGGSVHGGAVVSAVRAGTRCAGVRHFHRRDHRIVRCDRCAGAERHQAYRGLLDLLAARLHVRRDGHRRLFHRHVPSVHPCLFQGAALPRIRLRDPRHAS